MSAWYGLDSAGSGDERHTERRRMYLIWLAL
jgi:hypothetical protein